MPTTIFNPLPDSRHSADHYSFQILFPHGYWFNRLKWISIAPIASLFNFSLFHRSWRGPSCGRRSAARGGFHMQEVYSAETTRKYRIREGNSAPTVVSHPLFTISLIFSGLTTVAFVSVAFSKWIIIALG